MAGKARRFGRDAFHQVAVTDDAVGHVVDNGVSLTVEFLRHEALSHRQADSGGEARAQGSRGHLDAGRVSVFWVTGGLRSPLAEVLDLIEREVVPGQVKQGVNQHRAMAG